MERNTVFTGFVGFLIVAALALVASASWAQSQAGASFGATIPLRFTRTAPTATPTWQDSITITGTADTIRTSNINTDGWDWTSSLVATTTAGSVRPVAWVAFWVPSNATTGYQNTTPGDSLTYVVEPSFDGGLTYVCNSSSYASLGALGMAHGFGNFALKQGFGANAAAGTHLGTGYRGALIYDPDTQLTPVRALYEIAPYRDFRLKIFGTSSGVVGTIRGAVYPLVNRTVR